MHNYANQEVKKFFYLVIYFVYPIIQHPLGHLSQHRNDILPIVKKLRKLKSHNYFQSNVCRYRTLQALLAEANKFINKCQDSQTRKSTSTNT